MEQEQNKPSQPNKKPSRGISRPIALQSSQNISTIRQRHFSGNRYTHQDPLFPYSMKYSMAKILLDDGKPISQISRELALSRQTIYEIKNGRIKTSPALVDSAKKALDAKLTLKSQQILENIDERRLESANLSALAMSFGIMFDKQRINAGQSTANISVVDLTNSLNSSLSKLNDIMDKP